MNSLQELRRRRFGKSVVPIVDAATDVGHVVGSEAHWAAHTSPLVLTMGRSGGEFNYSVHLGDLKHSGRWLPPRHSLKSIAAVELADGIRVVRSQRRLVVIESSEVSLSFRRVGLTVVEAARADDSRTVARFRALPSPRQPRCFIEIDPGLTPDEQSIAIVAMASGVVLMLRPLPQLAVANWPFAWQRPVLAGERTQRRWLREIGLEPE